MMGNDDGWVEKARALTVNGSRKIVCCGSSPSMHINHKPKGVSCYCHRCGRSDFVPHEHRSVAAIAATWAEYEAPSEPKPFPDDCLSLSSEDTPPEARVWLLRAGISLLKANSRGFRYSPSLDRVLFPVYSRNYEYLGFVARSLSKWDQPKYRASVSGAIPMQVFDGPSVAGVAVVVEDQLSAIKLNMAGWRGCAVFGTSMRREDAQYLSQFDTVISWFDDDAGGRKGHIDLRKKLALTDCNVIRVRTPQDPKMYSVGSISEIIVNAIEGEANA